MARRCGNGGGERILSACLAGGAFLRARRATQTRAAAPRLFAFLQMLRRIERRRRNLTEIISRARRRRE